MADEHIAWWSDYRRHHDRITAKEAWSALTDRAYPGGGWERVRAEMVRWLLDQAEPAPLAA